MERPVIIRRIVTIIAFLDHLIDKPSVDSFVEMRRFNGKKEKAQEYRESEDEPGRPASFGQTRPPFLESVAESRHTGRRIRACASSLFDFRFQHFSHNGHKGSQQV